MSVLIMAASVPRVMPVPLYPVATYTFVEPISRPIEGSPSAGSITWDDHRYWTEATLKQALQDVRILKDRYSRVAVHDRGMRYNTDLLEAAELGFLLELAEVMVVGALARTESRGGHAREDYTTRDDTNWMRHTMAYRQAPYESALHLQTDVRLDYKPVVQTRYQPTERKY